LVLAARRQRRTKEYEGVDGTMRQAQILVHLRDKIKFRVWDSLSPRRRKLLFWVVGLLLFYTVAGFLILPPIIRAVAVKQLSKQLDREVSIQKVKLNPFALSTTIRGLLIKDKDGEPFVSWDEVYVNFQLSSFFGKAWVFKEISVTRPFARAQMNKDYTFNFSDLIAKFSTNAPGARPNAVQAASPCTLAGCTSRGHRLGDRSDAPRTVQAHVGPLDFTLRQFPHRSGQQKSLRLQPAPRTPAKNFVERIFLSRPAAFAGRAEAQFNFTLNKYAPLYQDRCALKSGTAPSPCA
jgi:hypothetical protein